MGLKHTNSFSQMVTHMARIDFFVRQRIVAFVVFVILCGLVYVSIVVTEYDVAKGFTSIPKAVRWSTENFYPDADSFKKINKIATRLSDTIITAVTATTCASLLAFFFAIIAATSTRPHWLFSLVSRAIASLFRNVDVSAWALILLFSFGQSTFTGYLALFFVTFGFMVRVLIETIDQVSGDSIVALRATGAGAGAVITQSVIPACLPQIVSWTLFMIETNIRSATLVGILTGTGIGYLFDIYYKSLNYHAASLVIVAIVLAVLAVEALSNTVRRMML